MPPRRNRRAAKAPAKELPLPTPPPPSADELFAEQLRRVSSTERDRRIAAIKAIEEAEAENTRSWLQMMQSYLSNEQLESKAMDFFQENFPNLSVVPTHSEEHNVLELKWNDGNTCTAGDLLGGLRASIASLPTAGGLQFPGNSVGKELYGHTSFDFNDPALSELLVGQMDGATVTFQTPGAVSSRLSFGMTPKTKRLPKNGEMILSVHGSPLGLYNEENLAAIQESGNGSKDGPC